MKTWQKITEAKTDSSKYGIQSTVLMQLFFYYQPTYLNPEIYIDQIHLRNSISKISFMY